MSATFLFDMAMIVLFPIMGRALGMTDQAFGICRYGGERHQDCQQVPDGLRTGCHRIEYLLRQHEEGWHPPMIHGFIISALVVIVALLVEMGMGIV